MRRVMVAVCALALLAALGCGTSGPAGTPEGTAQAFLAAVREGDAKKLAGLYDYVAEARRQNESWDDIPRGQRDLIVGKLIEEQARSLQGSLPRLQQVLAQAEVGAAQVNGDQARVEITGAAGLGELALVQREGKWYVAQ